MRRTKLVVVIGLVVLSCAIARGAAQESMGTAAAKAEFERGEAAFKAPKYDVAVQAYKKAIAQAPAYREAHEWFVRTSLFPGRGDDAVAVARLEAIYRAWIKAHPRQAAYYWGLGYASLSPSCTCHTEEVNSLVNNSRSGVVGQFEWGS